VDRRADAGGVRGSARRRHAVPASGERFGTRGLREFVSRHHHLDPEAFIQRLHEEYLSATGGRAQEDDLTAVVLKRL